MIPIIQMAFHVLKEYDTAIIASAIKEYSADHVWGYPGRESSLVDKKFHVLPVSSKLKYVSSSRLYSNIHTMQDRDTKKFYVTFYWLDNSRREHLERSRRAFQEAGLSVPRESNSAWRYSVISEHDKAAAAKRAGAIIAKKLKNKREQERAKKIKANVGDILNSRLGSKQVPGRIGDFVTFVDGTFGIGWLWEIIKEDNNETQFKTHLNLLTIRPVWTGMDYPNMTLKHKFVHGCDIEPVTLLELGSVHARLCDIIETERKRKSGE